MKCKCKCGDVLAGMVVKQKHFKDPKKAKVFGLLAYRESQICVALGSLHTWRLHIMSPACQNATLRQVCSLQLLSAFSRKVQQSFIGELKQNGVLRPDAAVSYRSTQAVWMIHQAKKKKTCTKGYYFFNSSVLILVRNKPSWYFFCKQRKRSCLINPGGLSII